MNVQFKKRRFFFFLFFFLFLALFLCSPFLPFFKDNYAIGVSADSKNYIDVLKLKLKTSEEKNHKITSGTPAVNEKRQAEDDEDDSVDKNDVEPSKTDSEKNKIIVKQVPENAKNVKPERQIATIEVILNSSNERINKLWQSVKDVKKAPVTVPGQAANEKKQDSSKNNNAVKTEVPVKSAEVKAAENNGSQNKIIDVNVSLNKAAADIKNAVRQPAQNPVQANGSANNNNNNNNNVMTQPVNSPAELLKPAVKTENKLSAGESFSVVIDPGHGGKYEPARNESGDHWDPFSKTFLLPYNFGASANGLFEHEWTLQTAKKVKELLALTQTEEGFKVFAQILKKYDPSNQKGFKWVKISCDLTREYSHDNDPDAGTSNINKKYRLFDSPESFAGGKPSEKLALGRISYINQKSPDLVVCIHNNSSPSKNARGYSAVIAPHFKFFSNVNSAIAIDPAQPVKNGGASINIKDHNSFGKVQSIVLDTFKTINNINVKTMVSDTATYFTGFRAFTNKFIGLRYLMVTWRYNTHSALSSFVLFFMRENSIYEQYKRAGGPEGHGGDNFYSSEELIRFIRYSLWNEYKQNPSMFCQKIGDRYPDSVKPDELLGKHGDPFISDWAIPLYVNAITAFIEVGYISNAKDRKLLKGRQEMVAEGIAVGIYSLFAGFKPSVDPAIEMPKGAPIDFEKYGRDKNSNGYFNISSVPVGFNDKF